MSTSVAVEYQSNGEGRRGGGETVVLTANPRVHYERNAAARLRSHAEIGVDVEHGIEGEVREHQDISSAIGVATKHGAWGTFAGNFGLNYNETSGIDYNVDQRLSTKTTGASGNAQAAFGRIGVLTGGNYSYTRSNGYGEQHSIGGNSDFRVVTIGQTYLSALGAYTYNYAAAEPLTRRKIDQSSALVDVGIGSSFFSELGNARIGVSHRELSRARSEMLAGPASTRDRSVTAAISGPFLPPRRFPKVTTKLSLAYGPSQQVGLDDDGTAQLTGALALGWTPRKTTNLQFSASRDRSLTVTNLSSENTMLTGGFTQAFNHGFSLNGTFGYQWSTFRSIVRKTESLIATAGLTKTLGTRGRWSSSVLYRYREAASTARTADIEQHDVVVSLNYTWTRVSTGVPIP